MDRIQHEKLIQALREEGGVQFLSLLPEASGIIYNEATREKQFFKKIL